MIYIAVNPREETRKEKEAASVDVLLYCFDCQEKCRRTIEGEGNDGEVDDDGTEFVEFIILLGLRWMSLEEQCSPTGRYRRRHQAVR